MAVVLTSVSAQAGVWVGETPVVGKSYYLYSTLQNKFLNDNNGFDEEDATTLWTVGGTFNTSYTLTSQNGNQFAMYREQTGTILFVPQYAYYVVTNATGKSGSDVTLSSGLSDGKYSICRQDKNDNWSGDRNVQSTSEGLSRVKDASFEWLFISEDQYNTKKNYEDLSSEMTDAWEGATNTWNGGSERYNGNTTPFPVGVVLSQTIENLENGYYEVQFYAFENWADWDESANLAVGENICEAFANDAKYSLTSIRSRGDRAFDENTLVTLICQVTDGTLTYGIRNIAVGGNWAVCKAKSLTFLGDTKANIAVNAAAQYATFCAPFEVPLPEGVTASTVKGVEGGLLTLTPVEGVLPANTAVILNAEAGLESTDFYGFSKATGTTVTTGLLTGVYVDTEITEGYVMQKQDKVGFYEVISANPKTVPAYHAYLTAPAGARFFGFDVETAISAVDALTSGKAQIFDLQGRRLNRLQKGINIVNGVKILVK